MDDKKAQQFYNKGARVQAPEPKRFWDRQGMSRRDRRRMAERAYKAGRMTRATYLYLIDY